MCNLHKNQRAQRGATSKACRIGRRRHFIFETNNGVPPSRGGRETTAPEGGTTTCVARPLTTTCERSPQSVGDRSWSVLTSPHCGTSEWALSRSSGRRPGASDMIRQIERSPHRRPSIARPTPPARTRRRSFAAACRAPWPAALGWRSSVVQAWQASPRSTRIVVRL